MAYSYLHYNDESGADFKAWVVSHDWSEVLQATGSNRKVDIYQAEVMAALHRFFPLKITRRRLTDLPWINTRIRKKIARRKAIFRDEGRLPRWRRH